MNILWEYSVVFADFLIYAISLCYLFPILIGWYCLWRISKAQQQRDRNKLIPIEKV